MPFDVIPSSIDEGAEPERDPAKRAEILASRKAWDIQEKNPECWVIGADTLVVSPDGELLEKPMNETEARRMLGLHSGRISIVHSAVSLVSPDGTEWKGLATAAVRFNLLNDTDIDWWIRTGEWRDRSGGFQVEDLGERLIRDIVGDRDGVIGLPLSLLEKLFKTAEAPFSFPGS